MAKVVTLLYAAVAYVVFLGSFLYAVGFVGNVAVPKAIDSGATGGIGEAVLVDGLLLALFAIQHSVMARPAFKAWWVRVIPRAVERSTYVLVSSLLLLLLFWQWRPLPTNVWNAAGGMAGTILAALSWVGWLIVLLSTFMISHLDLFGLRQALLHLQGKAYQHPPFVTRGLYTFVRHPIMLGFVIAFWATPTMTLGHLLFAVATTVYILAALQLEERDLVAAIGDDYRSYQRQVPMIIPWPKAGPRK